MATTSDLWPLSDAMGLPDAASHNTTFLSADPDANRCLAWDRPVTRKQTQVTRLL